MTFTRTALFLALALSASTAFAQQDISKVNGSVTAEAGQAYGDLETVNGSIRIGAGATVDDASTVNGSITVGDGARLESLEAVNGSLRLGRDVQVAGGIETVNGDITVGIGSHVKGGIKVEKPRGWSIKPRRDPRIIIGPNAVVEGPLVFERPVTLYVHTSARIGAVTGATAKPFSTDTAPTE